MIRRSTFLPFLAGLGVSLAMLLALAASDIAQPDGSGSLVQAAILGSTSLLLGVLIGVLLSRTRRPQQVPQEAPGSLRQILDTLPDGILHCSHEGEILMANRTAAQLLGQQEVLDEKLASRFVLVDRLSRSPFTPALWAELQLPNEDV